ncbi:MAG: dephospho-CoA kinase [Clostridia bacterium]|nr:dephospho-CoA kinase [Clostridia bacterium]
MKIIGLTGRSGSGKGAFCKAAENCGIPCLDTDLVARKVVEKGTPCLSELTQHFGESILNSDGTLNRKALGNIAFSDKDNLCALNSITHKYITAYVENWLEECKSKGYTAAVIDAPQLFESGENALCHNTVAIVCDENERIIRIISRDGITREYAEKRLSSQKSDKFFIDNCTHIIYNNDSEEELSDKVYGFFSDIGITTPTRGNI